MADALSKNKKTTKKKTQVKLFIRIQEQSQRYFCFHYEFLYGFVSLMWLFIMLL